MRLLQLCLIVGVWSAGDAATVDPACPRDTRMPRNCGVGNWSLHQFPEKEVLSDIHFTLFTKKHTRKTLKTELVIGDKDILMEGKFDFSEETKIVIHGYFSSANNFRHLLSEYALSGGHNVIMVDWQALAIYCYSTIVDNLPKIGDRVGQLLDFLVASGANPKRLHLIGHSLGAHIAGLASNTTHSNRVRVGRISALDPARPCFFTQRFGHLRLGKQSADSVDVIHTSGGFEGFGIPDPIGHLDFYPNNGTAPQPGCEFTLNIADLFYDDVCSHSRAHQLFAESISTDKGFLAVKCDSWEAFQNDSCNCANSPTTRMGERADFNSPSGSYYLITGKTCPFYRYDACNSATTLVASAALLVTMSIQLKYVIT